MFYARCFARILRQHIAAKTYRRTLYRASKNALLAGSIGIPLLTLALPGIPMSLYETECESSISSNDDKNDLIAQETSPIKLFAEESGTVGTNSIIKFYSCATYQANAPIEDRRILKVQDDGDFYAAVFDGHGGWQVSDYVSKVLIDNVQQELNQIKESLNDGSQNYLSHIDGAFSRSFSRTDRDLAARVRNAFEMGFGALGRCGSCAQVVYIHDNIVAIANAGDIRSVLGKRIVTDNGASFGAVALSNDHNAMEDREQKKLQREHPGEADVFKCKHPDSCYVKGALQPTRAFGDFALKFSEFNGPPYTNGDRSAGRHIALPYTPPYITAIPEVRIHKVTEDDEFIVIGTDGLWDYTSNEEAASIIKGAMERGEAKNAARVLIENVLQKSATRHNMSVARLSELSVGRMRRRLHDDISVTVLFLKQNVE